jgi:hypothetical protein
MSALTEIDIQSRYLHKLLPYSLSGVMSAVDRGVGLVLVSLADGGVHIARVAARHRGTLTIVNDEAGRGPEAFADAGLAGAIRSSSLTTIVASGAVDRRAYADAVDLVMSGRRIVIIETPETARAAWNDLIREASRAPNLSPAPS